MDFQLRKVLIPPHPSTNFKIKNYYQNEPRVNGVYSRDNLSKVWAHLINLLEYANVGTHWIALYVKNIEITYFHSFGVKHVSKKNRKIYWSKNT